jgi:hypothetical protein
MIQRSDNFGFPLEPRETLGVLRESRWQNFDRNFAIEFRVSCAIHLAHSTSADRRKEFVGSQTRAGG